MRIAVAAIVAVLCFGPAFGQDAQVADNWSEFRDPTGAFSVQFPQPPTVESDATTGHDGSKVSMTEYLVDRGSMALIVMVGDFTAQSVDPQNAVEGAVHGTQSGNRILLTDQVDDLDGQSGRSLTLTDPDGDQLTDRIFFVDGRLYQTITVLPKDASPAEVETVAHFSQSLHFLAK